MVMRSASKTARKLTFGEVCGFPKLALRKVFGILNLPVRRIFPIETLSSITRAVNFGLVADEAPMGFGDTM